MKSLLIFYGKFENDLIKDFSKEKNCIMLIAKRSISQVLNKKKLNFDKIILISEKILPRSKAIYKDVIDHIKDKKVFFVEIGYKKSKVPKDKAFSDALINGTGNNLKNILKRIINNENE